MYTDEHIVAFIEEALFFLALSIHAHCLQLLDQCQMSTCQFAPCLIMTVDWANMKEQVSIFFFLLIQTKLDVVLK